MGNSGLNRTNHCNNTGKPVYSGHAIQWTPCNSGHFFMEPAVSQSMSHRKHLYCGHFYSVQFLWRTQVFGTARKAQIKFTSL